jgi:CTP synthase
MKVDPYLNVDAGTMNPTEHGEVFVLNSGLETDQDMGNYERFSNKDADDFSYMTSGMVYRDVIEKERNLAYGGKCVEAIPDVRDEIINRFNKSAQNSKADISIVEIGGTIGDFQNALFYESARVMKFHNPDDVIFVMVSYLPIPGVLGEMKTKPTQNAIRQLSSFGIQADFVIARSSIPMDEKRKEKLAITCGLKKGNVISAPDIESIYDVPLNFEKDKIGEMVARALSIPVRKPNLTQWKNFVQKTKHTKDEVVIAIIGKYFDTGDFVLSDSYLSIIESIKFSAYHVNKKAKIVWLNSKEFEKNPAKVKELSKYDGVLVPGGFGSSGIEGKIKVIEYCRKNKIPYFGICYGMQLMVIEYARNIAKLEDAHTTEINSKTKYPVIDIMLEQKAKLAQNQYGGTMRLGAYDCILEKGTIAYSAYTKTKYWNIQKGNSISERHRHRYEVNNVYLEEIKKAGLVFSGASPDGALMEIAEIPKSKHPFFLGVQFHPEFKGRPLSPHPLFTEFVKASVERRK